MAKQIINVGTSPNDRKGDSLRAAFQKVNANFTELYTALGLAVDANLNLGAFEFNGSTMTTTDSTPVTIDQQVNITSDLVMSGDILPSATDIYDLGSPTKQWRSLYLTGSTVYFNGIPLSVTDDGTIIVNGEVAATPGGDLTWDSITGKPTFATVATSGSYRDLTNKPTFGASDGLTATTDVNGNVNIGFSGILYVGSQTQYGFEEIVDESGPSPVYSSRLSLPLTTEFLGGDISLTSWGLGLNINTRNPDPFTDYTWSFRYDGTLIAPSTIAFGDGNRTNINQVNNNFVITTNTGPGDPYSWTFDEFGNLTLPGGAVIDTYGDGAGGSTYLWSAPGEVIAVRSMIDENSFGGGIDVRPDGSVDIIAQNISSASWRFNENGSLTFPNLTTQTTAFTGTGNIEFRNDTISDINGIAITNASQLTNDTARISIPANGSGSVLITNNSNQWEFSSTGSLTFPNNTQQTTAWTGSVSSLVNGNNTVSLEETGTLTTPAGLSISKQLNGSAVHIGSTIQTDFNKNLRLQTIGTGSGSLAWQNNDGDVNFITLNYNQSKNILITTGNAVGEGISHNWVFNSNGNLTLPNNSVLAVDGNNVEVRNVTNFNVEASGVVNVYTDSGVAGHQWQFGDDGTLTVPSPQSQTFLLTFDSSNYVPTLGKPALTLTGDAWLITGGIVYAPNGTRSLVLESFVPSETNPGYSPGDQFTFDDSVHGITGYTLTLTLTNVGEIPGQGWTSDIAAAPLPAYPSTINSNGAVKITADTKSWTLGVDGKLTLPAGGDIVDSAGNSVLGGGGGNANTGDITFSNNILRNTTSLGGEVNIETASQQGDSNKAWSFNHDGAGSLYVPTGSSIKADKGLNIVATDTGFANFTNVRDFDTNSYLDFDYISIVNPSADILDKINPSSPNYAAGVGATVRFVYADYKVQEAVITEGFAVNSDDPFTGLPRYTGRINFNSTTMQDLIKEISFNNSANWRFTPGGKLYLPLDGQIIGAQSTDSGFPHGLIRLVPNDQDFPGGPDGYITFGQYIDIYPTTGFDGDVPHIHIAAGKGEGGTGDLILGDDNLNVEINHQGYVTIKSYDQLRNTNNFWYFSEGDGTLFGPSEGRLLVAGLGGAPGQDLYLTPGGVSRNTSDIEFVDADSSFKTVYTVNTNAYFVGNIPAGGSAFLWYQNGSSVMISSIVQGEGTATFTLSEPVGLVANTSYTVEWPGVDAYDVRVQTQNGDWRFKDDGSFSNRGSFTRTTTPSVNSLETSAVVWTGLFDYISGAKLTIQLETNQVGDDTGWHSQMCEAIIASRGYANSAAGPLGDPIMTVYGVTYTSTVPLATFTVQRNPTTKRIEVVATRTAATTDSIAFRIYSVETSTRD